MALFLRQRAVPKCVSCLQAYTFVALHDVLRTAFPSKQQTRNKKKMSKVPTMIVELLQDMPTYGRAGAFVPVTRGTMRSLWYPKGIAKHVSNAQTKKLVVDRVQITRDYAFGIDLDPRRRKGVDAEVEEGLNEEELRDASAFQKTAVNRLTPARSAELIELFVPARVEFYRQPILEDTRPAQRSIIGGGAAADLAAARMEAEEERRVKVQAIYGSVSTQDVLNAVRAAMGNNDEAARVLVQEADIQFVELAKAGIADADPTRVKQVGDFTVEIRVPGAESAAIRKTVRVIAQEA